MSRELVQVAAWLQPEDFLVDVDVHDATHALHLIADAIALRHQLEPDRVFRALARREAAASTGIGGGLAIPHGRIGGLTRPLTLLLRARRPIPFRAPDGEPVSLMLAIMVPEDGDKDEHLQLLALVAQSFSQPRFRAEVDDARTAEEIAAAFRSQVARLGGTSP